MAVGAEASPDAIEAGLTEFAGRANLGPEQFLRQMGQEGVAPETVRDFVANGITWRIETTRGLGHNMGPFGEGSGLRYLHYRWFWRLHRLWSITPITQA